MKHLLASLFAVGFVLVAIEALAQSAVPNPASTSPPVSPSTPTVQTVTAPAAPVNPSRGFICRAAAQKYRGQERADQIQLCMAQARLDCLRQAIDQKVVGPARKDFVQNCVGE